MNKSLFRIVKQPKLTEVSRDSQCDSIHCLLPSIKPRVPKHQVFQAMVTHVDEKAVVWVVSIEDLDSLDDIAAGCLECRDQETEVSPGLLCVGGYGRKLIRVRVLKDLEDGSFLSINVDSGEMIKCLKENLYKISARLLHIPPLAVPVKLYGVQKSEKSLRIDDFMLNVSISGPELGLVTVAVIEENVHTLPLPANIYYASNEDKYGGNLAFRMLKMEMVRVIVTYNDWNLEYYDHGLDWLIGTENKLHELSHLPFPLPLAAGIWLNVSVEGQEFQMRNGDETEPTVHCSDASKVGLRVLQTLSNTFTAKDQKLSSEIKHSLRITEEQVSRLTIGFLKYKKKLQDSAETAEIPKYLWAGNLVLGFYEAKDSSESSWCRVNLTGEATKPEHKDCVWAFFVDYGHRALVKVKHIRNLEENLAKEPIYILEADFKMPVDNQQLKIIRKEITNVKDGDVTLIQVDKIVPRPYPEFKNILVSFSKAMQTNHGFHAIVKIC